jgi:hypothetical protein
LTNLIAICYLFRRVCRDRGALDGGDDRLHSVAIAARRAEDSHAATDRAEATMMKGARQLDAKSPKKGRCMPFMMDIDAARPSKLDQLAIDYFSLRTGPSIDFCRRAIGVEAADDVVARRLGVAISTVRGWRVIGRRAS